jgi:phage baseplate assembly protein W
MPLERVSRGFKDISLTLKRNPLTRDLLVLQNEYAISRSVQNLVLTVRGEKFFDPDFGSAANRLLFENIDFFTADSLKDEIEDVLKRNEPRIELQSVDVTPNYDDGIMEVTIKYFIVGIDATPQQLQFVLLPTR